MLREVVTTGLLRFKNFVCGADKRQVECVMVHSLSLKLKCKLNVDVCFEQVQ
jgi:hypothetical protein